MAIIRRIIISSLLIGNCLGATTISMEKSISDGTLQNAYTKTKSGWSFVKNTNYFDRKDTSVGVFSVKNPRALEKATKELEKIKEIIETAKAKFPDYGNKSQNSEHETIYKIDQYLIGSKHPLFNKTKQVFEAIHFTSELEQTSGVKLDVSGAPILKTLKGGKVVKSKQIPLDFECDQRSGFRFCDFSPHGLIYLEK